MNPTDINQDLLSKGFAEVFDDNTEDYKLTKDNQLKGESKRIEVRSNEDLAKNIFNYYSRGAN